MESLVFSNEEVLGLLAEKIYFTVFDAESEQPVRFAGRIFGFRKTGRKTGVHELALALGEDEAGRLTYPTVLILDDRGKVVFRYAGFMNTDAMQRLLQSVPNPP